MGAFIVILILFLLITIVLVMTLFVVPQQRVAVIERFGKFHRTAPAGLNMRIPFIEIIAAKVSTQIQQLDVTTNTKTKDNVTLEIITSVQLLIDEQKVFDAFYKLSNPSAQIRSYVFDIVRAQVPSMTLDKVYESKDEIANNIELALSKQMAEFGYVVTKSLITDINPDKRVLDAMNQINEQERLRDAATAKAEAEKIIKVKQAEAEAEAMKLAGKGIADQRKEIIAGLRESILELREVLGSGVDPKEVMQMVMTTQYFDALKEIGANSKTNTLLLPHTSQGMQTLVEQMLAANLVDAKK
ncbi:MAG: hypothetical protein RLZZ293_1006 [Pseudomonadota bacterium]|jgi:regulator of protease activity HflC (stomatin/prohibitin superfamily)